MKNILITGVYKLINNSVYTLLKILFNNLIALPLSNEAPLQNEHVPLTVCATVKGI